MADIFLSYARRDIETARHIKDCLETLGFTVFFDVDGLDSGDVFPDILDQEVKAAKAVVGVWSNYSLSREWVKIECDIGKERGVLIPVHIEQIEKLNKPAAFWSIQYSNLQDFAGDPEHEGWQNLVRALSRTIEGAELSNESSVELPRMRRNGAVRLKSIETPLL